MLFEFMHMWRTSLNMDSEMSNYPLRPCCTCSSVRFPLGYCPSFNSLPLLSSTIFEVLPRPNEQHLCSSNHLHPSCILSVLVRLLYIWPSFQPPFLELCLDVWFLASWMPLDWFCLSIWNWLQVADLSVFEVCPRSDFEHNELTPWLKCSAISRHASSNPAAFLCVCSLLVNLLSVCQSNSTLGFLYFLVREHLERFFAGSSLA